MIKAEETPGCINKLTVYDFSCWKENTLMGEQISTHLANASPLLDFWYSFFAYSSSLVIPSFFHCYLGITPGENYLLERLHWKQIKARWLFVAGLSDS